MSKAENIRVVVRVRPPPADEESTVSAENGNAAVQVRHGDLEAHNFRCNLCFANNASQIEVFNQCGITNLLDSVLNGYRACAFAYGQTGSGKTYSIFGNSTPSYADADKVPYDGLMSKSLEYLFSRLEASKSRYIVRLTCVEIYHEQVYDLLAPPVDVSSDDFDRNGLIGVREHASEGFFLEGCHVVPVKSHIAALHTLILALSSRRTRGHNMNANSSRSHCLTDIFVDIPPQPGVKDGEGHARDYTVMGRMTLVDLAGSERLKLTKNTGEASAEAGFINKSLFVLGKVIAGLAAAEGDASSRLVPYRDSKLTKLLIGSLGGKGRTLMVACIRDGKSSIQETLRTLKFSMSCARIQSTPIRFLNAHEKIVSDLRDEIRRLANENAVLKSSLMADVPAPRKAQSSQEGPGDTADGEGDLRLDPDLMRSESFFGEKNAGSAPDTGDERIRQLEERIRRIESQSALLGDEGAGSQAAKAGVYSPYLVNGRQRVHARLQPLPRRKGARANAGARRSLSPSRKAKPSGVSSAGTLRRPDWVEGQTRAPPLKPTTPSPYTAHIKYGYHPDAYASGPLVALPVKTHSQISALPKKKTVFSQSDATAFPKLGPERKVSAAVATVVRKGPPDKDVLQDVPVRSSKPVQRMASSEAPNAAVKEHDSTSVDTSPVESPGLTYEQGKERRRRLSRLLNVDSSRSYSAQELEVVVAGMRRELAEYPEAATPEAYESLRELEEELRQMTAKNSPGKGSALKKEVIAIASKAVDHRVAAQISPRTITSAQIKGESPPLQAIVVETPKLKRASFSESTKPDLAEDALLSPKSLTRRTSSEDVVSRAIWSAKSHGGDKGYEDDFEDGHDELQKSAEDASLDRVPSRRASVVGESSAEGSASDRYSLDAVPASSGEERAESHSQGGDEEESRRELKAAVQLSSNDRVETQAAPSRRQSMQADDHYGDDFDDFEDDA